MNTPKPILTNEEVIEVTDLGFQAVGDYCKSKGILKGMPKEAHAGAMVHALAELGLLAGSQSEEEDKKIRAKAFFLLCKLENASQLRQDLERAGLIGKASQNLAEQYL